MARKRSRRLSAMNKDSLELPTEGATYPGRRHHYNLSHGRLVTQNEALLRTRKLCRLMLMTTRLRLRWRRLWQRCQIMMTLHMRRTGIPAFTEIAAVRKALGTHKKRRNKQQ